MSYNIAYGEEAQSVVKGFMARVYGWMFFALMITAGVSYYVSTSEAIIGIFMTTPMVFYGLLIGELILVIALSAMINKVSSAVAAGIFILYSALNGVTLSLIFLIYTSASLFSTFIVTAGTFGLMSLIGFTTKMDLSKIGSILFMALIGLIIASVVNMFMRNEMIYWIITYAGILIFVGLTAYDTQKLKKIALGVDVDSEQGKKASIIGALRLYLDFINLFLLLLRILGRRR